MGLSIWTAPTFCAGQERPSSKPSTAGPPVVPGDSLRRAVRDLANSENPYTPGASIRSRRSELDRTRWLFKRWVGPIRQKTDKTAADRIIPTVRDTVRGLISDEQFAMLEKAFAARLLRNQALVEEINWFEVGEKRRMLLSQGMPSASVDLFAPLPTAWQPPTVEQSRAALVEYKREQDLAEADWVGALDEILTPEQFDSVAAHFYRNSSNLAHPLFSRLLDLSQVQRRALEKTSAQYNTEMAELRERAVQRSPVNGKISDSIFLTDQNIRLVAYRPYEELSGDQFQKIARMAGILREGESLQGLRARLAEKQGPAEKVLGPLVDKLLAESQQP